MKCPFALKLEESFPPWLCRELCPACLCRERPHVLPSPGGSRGLGMVCAPQGLGPSILLPSERAGYLQAGTGGGAVRHRPSRAHWASVFADMHTFAWPLAAPTGNSAYKGLAGLTRQGLRTLKAVEQMNLFPLCSHALWGLICQCEKK